MAARQFPWKPILISLGLLALVGLIAAYQIVMRGFVQAYYRAEYAPEHVVRAELSAPAAHHRLEDVPWLSEAVGLAHSNSLRMLLAQQGRSEPRSTVDFAMGATWGATALPRRTGFSPGQDPEVGLLRGAPALGFKRRYLTTDDPDELLLAVRSWLAHGRAVRVAVDRATLLDQRDIVPHSVVLVGYDVDTFEYYEPLCDEPARCTPGDRPPGAQGLTVGAARLLTAMESLALALQYPWRYQLVVLEPQPGDGAALLEQRLVANARGLVGAGGPGPAIGAEAVLETAKSVERHGRDVVSAELLRGLGAAATARRDDREALLTLFRGRGALAGALEPLARAAEQFGAAQRALEAKEPEVDAAVAALRLAAEADREAGLALLRGVDAGVR